MLFLVLWGAMPDSMQAQTNEVNWTQMFPLQHPEKRQDLALAYDAIRKQVVLFGGHASSTMSDTWVWEGSNWTQMHPAQSPSPRCNHAMVYDAAHGQVVLFGGVNISGSTLVPLGDTWLWDGSNWTQAHPAQSPSARYVHSMAYDSAHGQVVLFGGFDNSLTHNDTWIWDGTTWKQMAPAQSPPKRAQHAMAYDARQGQTLLFGGTAGNYLNDTWIWDGSNWTQRTPAQSPSARGQQAMAYDTARSQIVLFGGYGNLSDTWIWDGSNWNQANPVQKPSARWASSMAYDESQAQIVFFGGYAYSGDWQSDTWILTKNPEMLFLPMITKPFSRPGFGVLETSHGTIVYQEGVALTTAQEVGASFEEAYESVGQDLGYPEVRPRIYVYRSLDDLLNDLIDTWHYSEWLRTYRVIPRMNKNYEAWIPPNMAAWFLCHEYSHRIIEKVAGLNSQAKYKWFDEGLAQHEGVRTWAVRSPLEAETARQNYWDSVKTGFQAGQWISLQALTTESQWTAQMETPNKDWIYVEATVVVDYLITQKGMSQAKAVLIKVGSGTPFADAFQQVFGQTVDQLEAEFIAYLVSH